MSSFLTLQHPPQAADEASAGQLLTMATEAMRSRRLAEATELNLGIQWAVLHGHPRDDRDPMVTPGGEGTPSVREHAIPELAMARETHPATTRALIADGLDLAHRLPRTWAVVQPETASRGSPARSPSSPEPCLPTTSPPSTAPWPGRSVATPRPPS